ncbi:MAG: hypothetical protein ABRQ27_05310 [Clostridiaceae bacterium]
MSVIYFYNKNKYLDKWERQVNFMWGSEQERRELAMIFPLFYGSHDERNYIKVIEDIKRLADRGYVPALYELGIAYLVL